MYSTKTKIYFFLTFLIPFFHYALFFTSLESWKSNAWLNFVGGLPFAFGFGGIGVLIGILGFLNKNMSKEKKIAKLWSIAFYTSALLTALVSLMEISS